MTGLQALICFHIIRFFQMFWKQTDVRPFFHPAMRRVPIAFEPLRLGDATGVLHSDPSRCITGTLRFAYVAGADCRASYVAGRCCNRPSIRSTLRARGQAMKIASQQRCYPFQCRVHLLPDHRQPLLSQLGGRALPSHGKSRKDSPVFSKTYK
jgi:hypothetical protein